MAAGRPACAHRIDAQCKSLAPLEIWRSVRNPTYRYALNLLDPSEPDLEEPPLRAEIDALR